MVRGGIGKAISVLGVVVLCLCAGCTGDPKPSLSHLVSDLTGGTVAKSVIAAEELLGEAGLATRSGGDEVHAASSPASSASVSLPDVIRMVLEVLSALNVACFMAGGWRG
jgi:hypothetical protein